MKKLLFLGFAAGLCLFSQGALRSVTPAVPDAPVAADLGQPLDVHGQVTAEVALHSVAVADDLTQLRLVSLGQILDAGIGVDPGLSQNLIGAGAPDAVDIGQANLDPLILGQINASNTCHTVSAPPVNLVSVYAWGFRR